MVQEAGGASNLMGTYLKLIISQKGTGIEFWKSIYKINPYQESVLPKPVLELYYSKNENANARLDAKALIDIEQEFKRMMRKDHKNIFERYVLENHKEEERKKILSDDLYTIQLATHMAAFMRPQYKVEIALS